MASLEDISLAAGINILSAFIFFVAFAILRLQPLNDRVYFPKWYLKGLRTDPVHGGAFVRKIVNLDWRSYIRFLNWMPDALRMPEPELIDHAGLDSVVYLRIYLLGYDHHSLWTMFEYTILENLITDICFCLLLYRLKIFVPIAFLAWAILVPVNWTSTGLEKVGIRNITSSDIDKISISNVQRGSERFRELSFIAITVLLLLLDAV